MYNQNAKDKLNAYFRNKLGARDYKRGWLKADCPSCGKHDKFGIHLGQGRTNCFVCTYNPTPIKLVMEQELVGTYAEAWEILGTYEGLSYVEPIAKKIEEKPVTLPEGFRLLSMGTGLVAKAARRYVEKRGFNPYQLALGGFGYCSRGEYQGYIIMPFYVGGKLVYFNARKFMGPGSKYKNPPMEEFGLGKSLVTYNIDALAIYRRVYLAEGLWNAKTMGDKGIATGGKKVSNYQLSGIIKSPVEEVVSLLDPDAWAESVDLAMEMAFHKRVKLIRLPQEKDVNDLGFRRTIKRVCKNPFLSYSELIKLKTNMVYENPIYSYH